MWSDSYSITRWPITRPSVRHNYKARLKVLKQEPMGEHKRSYERRIYFQCEPLPLKIAGTDKIAAHACGNCGKVYSTKYDTPTKQSAKVRALECCRHPHTCRSCGQQMESQWQTCNDCTSRSSYKTNRDRARKAEIVPDTKEPVWCNWSSGEWQEGYSSSLEAHLEAWEEQHADGAFDAAGNWSLTEEIPPPPPFVFCCNPITPQVCQQSIDESLVDELHEDFDVADLDGHDALCDAVEAFNKRQGPTSWTIDYSRVIVIDPVRFEEYLSTGWDGKPDVNYRATASPCRNPLTSIATPAPGPLPDEPEMVAP